MSDGWKTARLAEIPTASQRPDFPREGYFAAMEQRAPHMRHRLARRQRLRGARGRPHEAYTPPIWAWDWREPSSL